MKIKDTGSMRIERMAEGMLKCKNDITRILHENEKQTKGARTGIGCAGVENGNLRVRGSTSPFSLPALLSHATLDSIHLLLSPVTMDAVVAQVATASLALPPLQHHPSDATWHTTAAS